jgi:SAM-dependent methyltransferase
VQEDWFITWFNSPYYHILYKKRNDGEAKLFANNLFKNNKIDSSFRVLDLGCGKGRLSIELNNIGCDVIGLDISEENISYCQNFLQKNGLTFFQHDMRQPFRSNYFDWVINFFSSFGYFKNENDNLRTISQAYNNLKKGGFFLIDFMNIEKVIPNLIANETIIEKGIVFEINRFVEDGFIKKNILVKDGDSQYNFQEQVMVLGIDHFKKYFEQTGFTIENIYGDYEFNVFNPKDSDRLIIIAQK